MFERTVAPGSAVSTDTAAGYHCLDHAGYQHELVNHSQGEEVRGGAREQRAETIWSLWQPSSVPFRGVAHRYLPASARVFQFRRYHRQLTAFGRVQVVLTDLVQATRPPGVLLVRPVQGVLAWRPAHPGLTPVPL